MANKRLNAVITIGGSVSSSLKNAVGSTQSSLRGIGDEIRKIKDRQNELNAVVRQGNSSGQVGAALRSQYAQQELAQLDKKLAKLRDIERTQSKMDNAKSTLMRGGLAVGATIAAALPIIGAVGKAAEFNYQLQLIGNTADMTRQQIEALGKTIRGEARQVGQSATDMQKGFGFLIAAGMEADQAQRAIGTVGKAATASGGEIEDMAKAAFTAIDALKFDPAKGLPKAFDIMAQAGKDGNVELKDMAKQLPVLSSGFVALKMDGDEALATIAAGLQIARKGAADADEAANNMKNFIAKVMSPETLKKAEEKFGLDLYKVIQDAQTTGKNPFEAAMKSIMAATKGDQKAIGELFQDMQVQNFLRPMMQNWDKYLEIKNRALAADKVIDQDFAKVMETAKKQTDGFMNSIDDLVNSIGNALTPAFGALLGVITPAVQAVASFVEENKTLIGNIATFVGGAVGAIATFKIMGMGVAAVTLAFNALRLAVMTNPIGLALTLLVGAAALVIKNWEPIKTFFADLWKGVVDSFNSSIDWIIQKINWVGEKIQAAKKIFGMAATGGGEVSGSAGSPSAPSLPNPAARGATGSWSDNSQTTINVTQRPGEDMQALAERVTKLQEQRRGAAFRGRMADGLVAQ